METENDALLTAYPKIYVDDEVPVDIINSSILILRSHTDNRSLGTANNSFEMNNYKILTNFCQ